MKFRGLFMDRLPQRIAFHPETETMEADFSDLLLNDPAEVGLFYDAIEDRIRQSGSGDDAA